MQNRFVLSFFFTIITGEQYRLSEHSITPNSIIDLTSSFTACIMLYGNGCCLTRTGVSVVNFISCSIRVVLPVFSENVPENSWTSERTWFCSSWLKAGLMFTCVPSPDSHTEGVSMRPSLHSSSISSAVKSTNYTAQTCDSSLDCTSWSSSLSTYCLSILIWKLFSFPPILIR